MSTGDDHDRGAAGQTQRPGARDPFDYPGAWEADVVLADGGTVHVRPIVPSDADALVDLHGRLSERSRYLRFFGPYPRIPQRQLDRFTIVDHHDRVAFVALLGDQVVAVGRYDRLRGGPSAEVALVVDDDHQGRGLGSILLEHLAAAARERGLGRFVAEVLGENGQMVRVFRDAGYRVSRAIEEGVLHLEFAVDQTEASVAVARSREQAAEARSVHNLLHPRSVAVIGASSEPNKVGYAVLTNLLSADFAGPVYPVNSEHRSVRGVRAYPSVLDIPDPVDLAVVAVPAAGIDSVMDACLAKGVTTLVVLSSGFADVGPDGLGAERRLVWRVANLGARRSNRTLLRAPRPTLISSTTGDFFDIQGTWDNYRQAKRIFARLGYPERVDLVEAEGGHGVQPANLVGITRWMRRWPDMPVSGMTRCSATTTAPWPRPAWPCRRTGSNCCARSPATRSASKTSSPR